MLSGFDAAVSGELERFLDRHKRGNGARKVAVFDADGTLWRGDVGEAFFRYQIEKKLIPGAPKKDPWGKYLKESAEGDPPTAYGWLAQWNAGVFEDELRRWCGEFFAEQWVRNVFAPMRGLSHALMNAGFEIWVITGSLKWVVQTGVKGFGIQEDRVLGAAVAVNKGVLTDRLDLPVPYRRAKAELIRDVIRAAPLFGAGNTYWDKEMLQTASDLVLAIQSEEKGGPNHHSEQRLARRAGEGGWLVQRF